MLVECFDSTNSIWSFHFVVSGFSTCQNLQPSNDHIRPQKIFICSIAIHVIRSWMAYTFTNLRLSVCPLSNGISKWHKQINPTIKYPFIALQVEMKNVKDICNHNNHSAVVKNRNGYQFKRKLSIHSTIWLRSPLYHFINRNRPRFDSVGCLHLFSSSYIRSYEHLSKS